MIYEIRYTDIAKEDILSIIRYIRVDLLDPIAAANQYHSIQSAIDKLDEFPHRHRLYEKQPWKKRGLRIMPVDNYLVCYIPYDDIGILRVVRVVYGRRNLDRILKETEY